MERVNVLVSSPDKMEGWLGPRGLAATEGARNWMTKILGWQTFEILASAPLTRQVT